MPNGELSTREYDIFVRWFRGDPRRIFRRPPRNREGIREGSSYQKFVKERPFARVTQRTRDILEPTGGLPTRAVAAPETPQERVQRGIPARQAQTALGGLGAPSAGGPTGGVGQEVRPPGGIFSFINSRGQTMSWNGIDGYIQTGFDPERVSQPPPAQPPEISPFQQEQIGLQRRELELQRQRQQQAVLPPVTPFQQRGFDVQQQQFEAQQQQFQQQLEFQQGQARQATELQERQFASQLAANPINWLQYAAFTGEPPVIQPWMVPLGFQNTGGTVAPQGLQAGQPIPGFQPTTGAPPTTGAAGTQTFANLPQLTTPSAQFLARAGPTATQQFLGFQRARTGASPEESAFRLGSQRAPAGRFQGFSRFR